MNSFSYRTEHFNLNESSGRLEIESKSLELLLWLWLGLGLRWRLAASKSHMCKEKRKPRPPIFFLKILFQNSTDRWLPLLLLLLFGRVSSSTIANTANTKKKVKKKTKTDPQYQACWRILKPIFVLVLLACRHLTRFPILRGICRQRKKRSKRFSRRDPRPPQLLLLPSSSGSGKRSFKLPSGRRVVLFFELRMWVSRQQRRLFARRHCS